MLNKIYEAKKIKILLESLKNQKRTLSVPDLTEQSLIPMLYDWFNEIEEERANPTYLECVNQRKKFSFIILRLYSPGTILFGDMMVEGLRNTLAKLFDTRRACSVSNYCCDIVFMYKNYKETRDEIDRIYHSIVYRLNSLGTFPEE